MEIDVTHMVEDSDEMPMLSGSVAELGSDAGPTTWRNSKAYGAQYPLLKTDVERDAARAHFCEYGAWSQEEINAWDEEQLQAMTCQDAAAAIREMEYFDSVEEFEASDSCSGRLYRGDDMRWYFYLGN